MGRVSPERAKPEAGEGLVDTGHPWVARWMDLAMLPLLPYRKRVVGRARGRALEVGFGTGSNLRWYPRDGTVTSLVALEPDVHMRRRAESLLGDASFPVELVDGDAARMPFDDESFDTVVATFVLCTIPDVEGAAKEMMRVLRPNGVLLYAEHTAAGTASVRALQRAVKPCWCRAFGGCHIDREGHRILDRAGFEREPLHDEPAGLHPFPIQYGTARPRARSEQTPAARARLD